MAKLKEVRVSGLKAFNTLRIVPVEAADKEIYRIDEMATDVEYITWNETFSTPESALFFIAELAKAKGDFDDS